METYSQDKAIADLKELQTYLNNAINDTIAVIRVHDNKEQISQTIYNTLSGALRNGMMMAGYIDKASDNWN